MSTTTIPDALRPRIGKFIRLLGSDQPGDVVAAAGALKRALAGCGADLNDLGDSISSPSEPLVIYATRSASARRNRTSSLGDIELDYAQRRDVVEALRRGFAGGRMSEWETEFARSILSRLQGGNGHLTDKQNDALGRLLHRLGEGRAWA